MHVNLHAAQEEFDRLQEQQQKNVPQDLEAKKQAIRDVWAAEEKARDQAMGVPARPIVDRIVTPGIQAPTPRNTPLNDVQQRHQDAVDRNNARFGRK